MLLSTSTPRIARSQTSLGAKLSSGIEAAYTKADAELKPSVIITISSSIDEKRRKFALITFAETEKHADAQKKPAGLPQAGDEQKAEEEAARGCILQKKLKMESMIECLIGKTLLIKKAQGKKSKKEVEQIIA